MTTTDAAKLREAAQRLFSADSDYWFAIDHKPIASADAQLLARHILATVPACKWCSCTRNRHHRTCKYNPQESSQ